MSSNSRILKKSYAMQRMARAIERAVQATTVMEKERAARWGGAWGMLCGIRSSTVRLRRSDVDTGAEDSVRQSSDQIEIPGEVASPAASTADSSDLSVPQAPSQLPLSVNEAAIAAGILDPQT